MPNRRRACRSTQPLGVMKALVTVALCLSASAHAAEQPPIDEAVVASLVKRGMSESQVRAAYNACDSGGPISMQVCFGYRLEQETMILHAVYHDLHSSLQLHSKGLADELERGQ